MRTHSSKGRLPQMANEVEYKIDDLSLEIAKEIVSFCGRFLRQWQEKRKEKELEAKGRLREFELFNSGESKCQI